MLDITSLFISQAWAQTSPPPASQSAAITSTIMNFMPMVLIFMVFYVLIIRPQQKKIDEQSKMVAALRRGDRVITTGGIHGKISNMLGDDLLMLEIADGTHVKILRSHIASLEAKTDPATSTTTAAAGSDKKN